jgi:hypothetical protein
LLHAEFWWNALARLKLVTIAAATTTTGLLGGRRQRDICAYIDHWAEHLRDLRAMFHHLMSEDEQQNQSNCVQEK